MPLDPRNNYYYDYNDPFAEDTVQSPVFSTPDPISRTKSIEVERVLPATVRSVRVPVNNPSGPIQVNFTSAECIHLGCMGLVLLTLALTPVIAVGAAVLVGVNYPLLRRAGVKNAYYIMNLLLTLLITLLWLGGVIALGVVTYGVGALLGIFLIPLFILCGLLGSLICTSNISVNIRDNAV